jgi:hypothetical protein
MALVRFRVRVIVSGRPTTKFRVRVRFMIHIRIKLMLRLTL